MKTACDSTAQSVFNTPEGLHRLHAYLDPLLPALFGIAESALNKVAEEKLMTPFDYARSEFNMSIPALLEYLVQPYAMQCVSSFNPDDSHTRIPHSEISARMLFALQKIEEGDDPDIELPVVVYETLKIRLKQEVNSRLLRLSAEMKTVMHATLTGDDLAFVHGCHVRCMGERWDGRKYVPGNQDDLDEDIRTFQHIENILTEWRRQIEKAINANESTQNADMLPGVQEGIRMFGMNGGHINQLNREQILELHTRGLVTMMVHRLECEREVVVGTVSSLMGAPTNAEGPFPQLSVRTLALDHSSIEKWVQNAGQTLMISRSSVLPELNWDTLAGQRDAASALQRFGTMHLPRLGLAAAGKLAHMRTAQSQDLENVLFRIGRIESVMHRNYGAFNEPSAFHNAHWSTPFADSTHVDTIPIGDNAVLKFTWKWFCGKVEQACSELIRFGGILEGKGWDMKKILADADRIAAVVERRNAQ